MDNTNQKQALLNKLTPFPSQDGEGLERVIFRSEAYSLEPGITIREPFTRNNYSAHRPHERLPCNHKEKVYQCDLAYSKVGIIRNIIDLMADFASQGITINHPSRKAEEFLRAWFDKVSGAERSERFLSNLYRCGVALIRRDEAKTNGGVVFPKRYLFLNPLQVDVANGREIMFGQEPQYILRPYAYLGNQWDLTAEYIRSKVFPKTDGIPGELKKTVSEPARDIPLSNDALIVAHYKKDDWQVWADPLIYAILDDVILYQKAKLADLATLDGVRQAIRLFKLGNSEKGIYPKPEALNMLHSSLAGNTGGGPADLFWTDDIEIKQIETQAHQFLGSQKYEPILTAIYDGLGIPTSLTAKGGGNTGFTNNSLSLKTLIERLEYGRNQLISFWQAELSRVCKAFGLKDKARVTFAYMGLEDETARATLLTNLADRGYLSWETLIQHLGENVAVERVRLQREGSERASGKLPEKQGPFVSNGDGLTEPKGTPGRPKNAADTEKRKQRQTKVKPI